jgi:hypothetical protein
VGAEGKGIGTTVVGSADGKTVGVGVRTRCGVDEVVLCADKPPCDDDGWGMGLITMPETCRCGCAAAAKKNAIRCGKESEK